MIRVKVDWHHQCSGCGTELVTDFLDEAVYRQSCPWCGQECSADHISSDTDLREFVSRSIRELEQAANCRLPAQK